MRKYNSITDMSILLANPGTRKILISALLLGKSLPVMETNKIPEEVIRKCQKEGLFHVTPKKIADKIMETGKIKPSKGIDSVSCLGKKRCYFSPGKPTLDILVQNLSIEKCVDKTAIKLSGEQFKKLYEAGQITYRPYDNSIMIKNSYEGEMEKVEFDFDEINPKDFFIENKLKTALKNLYLKSDPLYNEIDMGIKLAIKSVKNNLNSKKYKFKIEDIKKRANAMKNGVDLLNEKRKKFNTQFSFQEKIKRKDSFFEKRIKLFKREGITKTLFKNFCKINKNRTIKKTGVSQLNSEEIIENMVRNGDINFFKQSIKGFKKYAYSSNKQFHGPNHVKRVAFHALAIASYEGELSDSEKEILVNASLYHDMGRVSDILGFDHGFRSAEKSVEKNIVNFEKKIDEKMFKHIVGCHDMLSEKGNIIIEADKSLTSEQIEKTKKLYNILQSADKLDRIRLNDLNPEYLNLDIAKKMVGNAYELYSKLEGQIIYDDEIKDKNIINKIEEKIKKEKILFKEVSGEITEEKFIEKEPDKFDSPDISPDISIEEIEENTIS